MFFVSRHLRTVSQLMGVRTLLSVSNTDHRPRPLSLRAFEEDYSREHSVGNAELVCYCQKNGLNDFLQIIKTLKLANFQNCTKLNSCFIFIEKSKLWMGQLCLMNNVRLYFGKFSSQIICTVRSSVGLQNY